MAAELLTKGNALVGALTQIGGGSLKVLEETLLAADFTDGGGTSGTKDFTNALPKGALVVGGRVKVVAGFAGDTSAAMTVGDGTDADRYNASTIDIFTTAADGIDLGLPSGVRFHDAAKTPKVTVTSGSNFTLVLAGGGSITVAIYYIDTVGVA
jgi:hypothetical protein